MGGPIPRVLLVDDDHGLLRLLERSLSSHGFEVVSVPTGSLALQWLCAHQADLLLLDLKLTDMEAQALIFELKGRGISIPFVIITGHGDERVAVEMMKIGASDYLVKDLRFLDLVPAVVHGVLQQAERERKLAAAEEALRVSNERFRVALKDSPITVFTMDRTLRYTWIGNPPPGVAPEAILGRCDLELFPPHEADRLTGLKERALRGSAVREEVHCTFQGVSRVFDLTIEPTFDSSGEVAGLTCAALDVTPRKELEKELLHISELEQNRIGQDLHDGICQQLAAIELLSEVLANKLERKHREEAAQASKIAEHVRKTIAQARMLARGLSPVALHSDGLVSALHELASNAEKLFGVTCAFACDPGLPSPDSTVANHLYRIAQEALSNAIKHGGATCVDIGLAATSERFILAVRDNGSGIPPTPECKKGMGLKIMQYRAGVIGGSLVIQREASGGTTVACSVQRGKTIHGPSK